MRNLSKVTYDKLMTVQNDIGGFQMNYDQFARTLWSKEDLAGSWSLRNKINKFHNCFFMVRKIVELEDFNAEYPQVIGSIQE